MEEYIGYILIFYIIAFVFSIVFLSFKVKKETGVFPIVRNTDNVHSFVDRIILFSYSLVIMNAVLYTLGFVQVYHPPFDLLYLQIIGLILIGLSMVTMFISQLQMKESWRIGIDKKSEINLVDKGMFKYFRHPIYLCAVIIGLGTIFVIPALSTAFIFFILWTAVSIQARLEESFLLSKFGKKYEDHIKNRKRYF